MAVVGRLGSLQDCMSRRNTLIALGALLVTISSLVSIYLTQCAGPGKSSLRPHVALGQVLAEETSKLLANKGRLVIVCGDVRQSETLKAEVESFTKSIHKQAGLSVVATEVVKPDPKRKNMASRQYLDLLEQYPNVDVIVSFAGTPRLEDAQISKLGPKFPKLVAVSTTRSHLNSLFANQ